MILINLLPHREAARKRRQEHFYASLVAAVLLGAVLSGIVYLWYETQISSQRGKNQYIQTEIKRLEAQIKDIATLQNEIAALRARQQAVEDLQADRNLPVHLLNEVARQLPNGVYVTSLRQQNQSVTLTGTAQSNERVSELLRNLSYNSPWLKQPELIEIVAGSAAQRRVSNFVVRVQLRRPSEAPKLAETPASAASAGIATPMSVASAAPASPASVTSVAPAAPLAASAPKAKP